MLSQHSIWMVAYRDLIVLKLLDDLARGK